MAVVRRASLPVEFWNYKRLFREVLIDKATTIAWCKQYGLLADQLSCLKCGGTMRWEPVDRIDGFRYDGTIIHKKIHKTSDT